MFNVQFYAFLKQQYVTISKHRKLIKAVARARFLYTDGGYSDVSILTSDGIRLDKYGTRCYFCNNSSAHCKNNCREK